MPELGDVTYWACKATEEAECNKPLREALAKITNERFLLVIAHVKLREWAMNRSHADWCTVWQCKGAACTCDLEECLLTLDPTTSDHTIRNFCEEWMKTHE